MCWAISEPCQFAVLEAQPWPRYTHCDIKSVGKRRNLFFICTKVLSFTSPHSFFFFFSFSPCESCTKIISQLQQADASISNIHLFHRRCWICYEQPFQDLFITLAVRCWHLLLVLLVCNQECFLLDHSCSKLTFKYPRNRSYHPMYINDSWRQLSNQLLPPPLLLLPR